MRLVKGCSDNPCQTSWVVSWNEIEWRTVRLGTWEGISNSLWGKKDTKEVLLIHLIRVFVLFFTSPVSTSYNLNWTVEDEKESVFGIWKTLSKNLSIIGPRCTRTKLTEWWRQFLRYTLDNNNIIGIIIKVYCLVDHSESGKCQMSGNKFNWNHKINWVHIENWKCFESEICLESIRSTQ